MAKILVIEDERIIRENILELLEMKILKYLEPKMVKSVLP